MGDLVDFLQHHRSQYDIILAIDLFIYLGDLSCVFPAIHAVLASGGILAASFEKGDNGFQLCNNRRYSHSLDYVREVSSACDLQMIHVDHTSLRKERSRPIDFYIGLFSSKSEK